MSTPWALHEHSMESMSNPWALLMESMNTPWALHEHSMSTPWALHKHSMDFMSTPWALHEHSMSSMSTPWALHGKVWGSVKYRLFLWSQLPALVLFCVCCVQGYWGLAPRKFWNLYSATDKNLADLPIFQALHLNIAGSVLRDKTADLKQSPWENIYLCINYGTYVLKRQIHLAFYRLLMLMNFKRIYFG